MRLHSPLKSKYTIYTPRRKIIYKQQNQPPGKYPGAHNVANGVGVEHRLLVIAEGKYVSQSTAGWQYRAARKGYCAASYVQHVQWTWKHRIMDCLSVGGWINSSKVYGGEEEDHKNGHQDRQTCGPWTSFCGSIRRVCYTRRRYATWTTCSSGSLQPA